MFNSSPKLDKTSTEKKQASNTQDVSNARPKTNAVTTLGAETAQKPKA